MVREPARRVTLDRMLDFIRWLADWRGETANREVPPDPEYPIPGCERAAAEPSDSPQAEPKVRYDGWSG